MSNRESSQLDSPEMGGFYGVARFITVYGTLTFLAVITFYLVNQAFGHGFYVGSRSLAGALLPVVVGSFLYLFNKNRLSRLGDITTGIGFLVGVIVAVVVMLVLRFFARTSMIPLSEFVVSGCFSVLVFSSASTPRDKTLAYYYGMMFGVLLYIILFGFPLLK